MCASVCASLFFIILFFYFYISAFVANKDIYIYIYIYIFWRFVTIHAFDGQTDGQTSRSWLRPPSTDAAR